jgi:hypothetical protein
MRDFLQNLRERIFESERLGGKASSWKWSSVRRDYLILHPDCEACGKKPTLLKPTECHHILPFNLHPELELSSQNLIAVCRDCHLTLAHLRSFKSYNKDIRQDAATLLLKIKNRP